MLYTDADLPFDMAEVKRACRLLRIYEADLICVSLRPYGEGFQRVIYSAIYNLLVRGSSECGPRRQLRVQARAPFGARRDDAHERGLVHRR